MKQLVVTGWVAAVLSLFPAACGPRIVEDTCTTPADCPTVEGDCVVGICEYGACKVQDVPAGTPLPEQTPGGCVERVCDGAGQVKEIDVCGCGNTVLDPGEECDDGNTNDADACSNDCVIQGVREVATGSLHACAVSTGNRVKCWGSNEHGELGLGDTANRGDDPGEMGKSLPFVDLGAGRMAVGLSAGYEHACALLDNGAVKCWGRNDHGQLGLGDTANRGDDPGEMGDALPAVDLGAGNTAVAVSAGGGQTCAVLTGGDVKCWGRNDFGQLGLGDTQNRGDEAGEMGDALPIVDLGAGKQVIALATSHHTCALLVTGAVKCWGLDNYGQLGLGDTQNRGDEAGEMGEALPVVDLGAGEKVMEISAGNAHTCALVEGGDVKCWGRSNFGQLGLGDGASRGDDPGEMGDTLPAVDLGISGGSASVRGGYGHTCALLGSGWVKCWAYNDSGQLGLGDTQNRGDTDGEMGDNLLPVAISPDRMPVAIRTGPTSWFTCAVLDDGSFKCWGDNGSGQLGLGDTENRGDQPGEMGTSLPTVKAFSATVW